MDQPAENNSPLASELSTLGVSVVVEELKMGARQAINVSIAFCSPAITACGFWPSRTFPSIL